MNSERALSSSTSKRHCMIVLAHYPLGETRVQREAETLLVHGYQVDIIALGGLKYPPVEEYRGVTIYRLPLGIKKRTLLKQFINYLRFFWLAFLKLNQLHRQAPYKTVQVHNLPDFLVFSAWRLKRKGVPVILDLHDLMPEFYAGRFSGKKRWLLPLVYWQEKWACRFADHVITVSDHWRETLIGRGVSPKKCSVVMNVADEKIFHPLPPQQTPRKDPAVFHLIYHGSIVYRYGLDLAIRAVKMLKKDIPGVKLTIIGDGDYVAALQNLVRELAAEDYVFIDHAIHPAEELPALLLTANMGIVPYRNDIFSDGLLPTKLMEYAALGLPAVVSKTTAIERYFKDTLVEFFEPGSVEDLVRCIRTLHANPQRVTQLAQGARKFTDRYNWTDIGAAYAAKVESLAAKEA